MNAPTQSPTLSDDLRALRAAAGALCELSDKLLNKNAELLSVIAEQRDNYDALLAACAANGSRTAADILRRLRVARARAEADA